MLASSDEDYFKIGGLKIPNLGLSHYYNPHLNQGRYVGFFGNAKDKGVGLFYQAEKNFILKRYQDSFFDLGRALHLLQDLASPAHVHTHSSHLFSDRFEDYADTNLGPPLSKNPEIIILSEPAGYFDCLARKTIEWEAEVVKTCNIPQGKTNKLPDEALKMLATTLIPLAIGYSAGLVHLFGKQNLKNLPYIKQKKWMLKS